MKYIIALDVGTSSMRSVLYGADGQILFTSGQEYHTFFPAPSQVEQDPATWKEAACKTLRETGAFLREKGLSAEAISITSQRSSLIPVDPNGVPLYNAIMWQDKRTLPQCDWLNEHYGMEALYRKTGLRINPYFVLPKLLWLKANRPDLYNGAYKFLGVQDYVAFELTGRFVTDWSQACRTMLMNIESFQWDPELLAIAGVTHERLPELLAPGSVAGGLTPAIAGETGLPAGLPVILAGGDQQNAAVALGVVEPGKAEANTGTGSFVIAYARKPIFDKSCRVLCQASAVAGKWIVEAGIFNTGAIYRWFKEECCPDLRNREDAYSLMNREAEASGIGANGVMLLPHFEGSAAPYWNPLAKGLFFNLSLGSKRGDMIRSILEGISMEISDNLVLIQSLSDELSGVSVAGGMVRSDLFCTIQANCYNKPVIRYSNSEASSLGAAILAAVTLGLYPDVESAHRVMAAGGQDTFLPNEEDVVRYGKLMVRKQLLYFSLKERSVYQEFLERV